MRQGINRKRYQNLRLVAGLVALLLLPACQTGSKPEGGESAAIKHKELPPASINIFSTSAWSQQVFDDRFGNLLRKKFPQHTITYQIGKSYDELLLSGAKADMIWESIATYSNIRPYNIQYDMTALIKEFNVDLSRIDRTFIDAMKAMGDGKMIGIPVLNNTLGLYYNKDLFDRIGAPYPKDGITWDEVLELNKKLTVENNGKPYVGLAIAVDHYFRMNPFSLPYLNSRTQKTTINSEEKWKTLYSVLSQASSPPVYQNTIQSSGKIPDTNTFFKDRNAAMLVALVNSHLTQDSAGLNWDMVKYPTFKEAPGIGPQSSPTIFGIATGSEHKGQVMEMINYLISDEFQLGVSRSGTLPVLKTPEIVGAFGKDTAFADKNIKAAFYDKLAPISEKTIYDSEVAKVFVKHTLPLAKGETDLNTMLRTAEEEANAAINKLKTK